MKFTLNQLRKIIKEERDRVLSEAGRRGYHLEDCVIGQTYRVGYRNNSWSSTFMGWTIEDGQPKMNWEDEDGSSWQAYLYNGQFAVGSSADRLEILG